MHRSMQWNREPRNKPTCIWSGNLQQIWQEYTMGERTVSAINAAGKTGQLHITQSNWTTVLHHTQK